AHSAWIVPEYRAVRAPTASAIQESNRDRSNEDTNRSYRLRPRRIGPRCVRAGDCDPGGRSTRRSSGQGRLNGRAHLLERRARVLLGALLPVLLVEQLDRQRAAETVVAQQTQDVAERRHPVARID